MRAQWAAALHSQWLKMDSIQFFLILNPSVIQQAKLNIEKNLQWLVDKNKIADEEKKSIADKLYFTNDIHECIADIIIEAIVEKD